MQTPVLGNDLGRVLLVLWATPTPLSVGEIAATAWPLALPKPNQPHARQIRIRLRRENTDRVRMLAYDLITQKLALRVGVDSLAPTEAGIALVESWGGGE